MSPAPVHGGLLPTHGGTGPPVHGSANAIGPNLITNGTFDTDVSGWTPGNATTALVSNKLRATTTAAFGYVYQSFTVTPDATYRLTYDTANVSGPAVVAPKIGFAPFDGTWGSTVGSAAPVIGGTIDFVPTATPCYVTFQDVNGLVGAQFDIDNIKVQRVG